MPPGQPQRQTVNNYLAEGGDGFATLARGRDPLVGVRDIDPLEAYLRGNPAASSIAPAVARTQRVTGWDGDRPACADSAP